MNRAKQRYSNFLAVRGNGNISRGRKMFKAYLYILYKFQIKLYIYIYLIIYEKAINNISISD